jgi:hypothetical protein
MNIAANCTYTDPITQEQSQVTFLQIAVQVQSTPNGVQSTPIAIIIDSTGAIKSVAYTTVKFNVVSEE